MKKINPSAVIATLALALLALGAVLYWKSLQGTGQNKLNNSDSSQLADQNVDIEGKYNYYAKLQPVDGSSASGEVGFSEDGSNFVMLAKFNDLVDPAANQFYEGWLVNKQTGQQISTGRATNISGSWINSFSSATDYTQYTHYVLTLEEDDANPEPATHILEGDLIKDDTSDQQTKNGYIKLSEFQADPAAYNQGNVVLFFNAGWCPTCKVLNESLNAQADQFPDNLTVVNVDYDNSDDLKSKYGIKVQHTLVQVDADGNQISTWTGGGDLQSITDQLK